MRGSLEDELGESMDSSEFAKDKPMTLLNGSNLLALLEKHGHRARPRRPPRVYDPEELANTNAFCGGQAFLADGRLLLAGGTREWPEAESGDPD